MKYINRLTDDRIKCVMEIYAPNHTDLVYKLEENGLRVNLLDADGCEDNYIVRDFDVEIIDWMGDERNLLIQFRKNMLKWFGEQYAIDYLLK